MWIVIQFFFLKPSSSSCYEAPCSQICVIYSVFLFSNKSTVLDQIYSDIYFFLMFMKFLFMTNQGIVSIEDFRANITRIGKIASKMFRLQMIPHICSRMIEKIITETTTKLFQGILSENNVLVEISWCTEISCSSSWNKM